MNDFKVSLKSYKFLQHSSLVNQQSMKSWSHKDTVVLQKIPDNPINPSIDFETNQFDLERNQLKKRQTAQGEQQNQLQSMKAPVKTQEIGSDFFYLNPPFPKIELSSIGPVFIENGFVHLYCEYNFDLVKCTVSGLILGEKSYLSTTQFTNFNFELISVNFDIEFIKLYFGFHNFNKNLPNDHTILHSVVSKNIENINLFSNYIMLFGSNGTNIDLFINDSQIDNQKENFLNEKYKFYQFVQVQGSLLFFLINIKLINFLLLLVNFTFSYVMHLPIYLFGRFEKFKANDEEAIVKRHWIDQIQVEQQSSPTTLNSIMSSGNSKVIISSSSISRQRSSITKVSNSSAISKDKLNDLVVEEMNPINNKYQLLYSLIIFHFLIHIIIYHLVNMIIQNSINGILSLLYLSSSEQIIELPPHGLISIMFTGIGPSTFQLPPGGAIFSRIINIIKCFANLSMTLFFHGLYCLILFSLTNN